MEKDILNTYFKLKTFQLIYNHTEIYEWIRSNIFTYTADTKPLSLILPANVHQPEQIQILTKKHLNADQYSLFEWLMKRIVVKGCAELWNISVLMKLNEQTSSLSVSHIKLLLEQYDEKRSSVYSNRLVNILLTSRHWSTELMVESLWWSLGSATRDNNLKKIHTRGSPFFLGVSLIKLSSYGNATKLDLSVHTLRTEYSVCLAEFILKLYECGRLYGIRKRTIPKATVTQPPKKEQSTMPTILVNAKITDITTYFFNHHEACMLMSLAEVTLARTQQITVLKFDGFQTAILGVTEQPLMSQNDFTDVFSNIKVIRIEYVQMPEDDVPQFNLYILNDSEAMWNTNLHMHIVTLLRDMKEFKEKILPAEVKLDIVQPADSEAIGNSSEPPKSPPILNVYAEGNSVFGIKFSERHSMQIFLENFYMSRNWEKQLISAEKLFINIDEMHIFTLKDIDMQTAPAVDVLRQERKNYDHFLLPTNKVWITTIGGFKGIFPYDHDFADAIQNECTSTFKWLKAVHNIQKKPFTADSPLPSDMIIQVCVCISIIYI